MRESINIGWITKYSWRVGVFITLMWTAFLAVYAASEILSDVDPLALQIISGSLDLGMVLMVFSFILAAINWGHQKIKTWRGIDG